MAPEIKVGCAGNLYLRQMHFRRAGDVEQGHSHSYDHFTVLAAGRLRVEIAGVLASEYSAPNMILIRKGVVHQLTALEAGTLALCCHALHRKDCPDEILDPNQVPQGVDPLTLSAPLLERTR